MATTRPALAAAVGLLLLAPAASAQTPPKELPTGTVDGVRVERSARDGIVVTFTDEAARLYRRIAGRRVVVRCSKIGPRNALGRGVASLDKTLVAPRKRAPLRTGNRNRGIDFCTVARADSDDATIVAVPLTQEGAVFLDEAAIGARLGVVLALAVSSGDTFLPAPDVVRRAASERIPVVALAAPADSPPPGQIGYYSDGLKHAAVVALSTSGRRLFIDVNGDTIATNLIDQLV